MLLPAQPHCSKLGCETTPSSILGQKAANFTLGWGLWAQGQFLHPPPTPVPNCWSRDSSPFAAGGEEQALGERDSPRLFWTAAPCVIHLRPCTIDGKGGGSATGYIWDRRVHCSCWGKSHAEPPPTGGKPLPHLPGDCGSQHPITPQNPAKSPGRGEPGGSSEFYLSGMEGEKKKSKAGAGDGGVGSCPQGGPRRPRAHTASCVGAQGLGTACSRR